MIIAAGDFPEWEFSFQQKGRVWEREPHVRTVF